MSLASNVKKTTEGFIKDAILVHGDRYLYPKVNYVRSSDVVTITCREHGDFNQTPNVHLSGKGCPTCGRIKSARNRTKVNTADFITKAALKHGLIYLYDKTVYKHHRERVTITCREHGDFEQRPDQHLAGQGCPKCAWVKRTDGNRLTWEEFLERSNDLHNGFYSYLKSKYINTYTPIVITCPVHGDFKQTPKNHLVGKGCGRCKESKGERALAVILDKYGISYQREYSFTNSLYRYDFFLSDQNILIEFHGEQHYVPVDLFNGEKGLEETKRRDAEKITLAEENSIPLIVLNYQHLNSGYLEQALIRQFKNIYRFWFRVGDEICTFRYAEEVSKRFGIKCSPLTRVTERAITEYLPHVNSIFNPIEDVL